VKVTVHGRQVSLRRGDREGNGFGAKAGICVRRNKKFVRKGMSRLGIEKETTGGG